MGVARRHHPFFWTSQPTLAFTVGTSATYELAQHIVNPHSFTLIYSVRSGTLPNGITLNSSTGRLTYTGASALTASVQFAVAAVGFSSESSPRTVTISQSVPTNQPPVWTNVPAVTFV